MIFQTSDPIFCLSSLFTGFWIFCPNSREIPDEILKYEPSDGSLKICHDNDDSRESFVFVGKDKHIYWVNILIAQLIFKDEGGYGELY